jgi:glycosyltransferase involved in cell wall biosynthesis
LAEQLSAFLGEPHPPIQVVPHGVWTVRETRWATRSLEERLLRKKLLFFGAIRRNKGLDLLLLAIEKLPGYRITIAGEPSDAGYFQNEIQPLVRRLRDQGIEVDLRAHFISDEEVGELFDSHSAIVLPYTRQFVAQSGVAFMALAYELPVIASDAGGLRDLLNEFRIGVTFPESEVDQLVAAVRELFEDGDVRCGLSDEIRAAKHRFSWQAAAGATIDGYQLAPERATRGTATDDCAVETISAQ